VYDPDAFWDDIIDMLSELRKLLGETSRYDDIDIIFDRDKHLIYVTMPLRHITEIREISVEDGVLYIWAKNGQMTYKELDLNLPIKSIVSYSFKNGVLDIVLEY